MQEDPRKRREKPGIYSSCKNEIETELTGIAVSPCHSCTERCCGRHSTGPGEASPRGMRLTTRPHGLTRATEIFSRLVHFLLSPSLI